MHIANKSAVVTGAAGGIGRAVAAALLAKDIGCVALVDSSKECHAAATRLNQQAGRPVAVAFQGDVTDAEFRQKVFTRIQQQHDVVRICIPAAGILRDALSVKLDRQSGQIELYSESIFRQVLAVNLLHPVYWAMQTIAGVATSRHQQGLGKWQPTEDIQASVVLLGSVAARGNRGQIAYASAKSALNAASATLNIEGMYHGVQCRIVHPGFVDTAMLAQMPAGYFEDKLKPLVALGRLIKPREIASVVLALIENPSISGAVWSDAGLTRLA